MIIQKSEIMITKINSKWMTSLSLIICHLSFSMMIASCTADGDMEQLGIEEPDSLAAYNYLKNFDVLRTYDAGIGVAMDANTFLEEGMDYRIAVANFGVLAPGMLFSHQQVMRASGDADTKAIETVAALAGKHGMKLLGAPLLSHRNQNATYLNALLAPNVIRPDGDDGGYCIKMINNVSGAMTDAQVSYTFAKTPQVEPGIKYKLTMMVCGTAEGTIQVATYSNGKGSRFTPNVKVGKEWQKVELQNTMASGIKGLTSILFNIGQYVGTLYVDNIELFEVDNKGNEVTDNLNSVNTLLDDAEQTASSVAILQDKNGSIEEATVSKLGEGYDPLATYVEKTDEEKRIILTAEIGRYLDAVISAADAKVSSWIVVSEPLAAVTDDASAFFWKNYLGDDYVVTAFQQAASISDRKLYIGAGELNTPAEAEALTVYIAQVEALGARIDGIALEVHAGLSAATDYGQIFQALAATGKHVMLSDLYVDMDGTLADDATEQLMRRQANKLTSILNAYQAKVPKARRGGIVCHQVTDGEQPFGLWTKNYDRKHAYGSVAASLLSLQQ